MASYSRSTRRRPSVPDRCVNSAQLLPGNQPYWMAANNYYIGHARLLTMMALSIDPASRCATSASFVRTTRDPTSRTTGSWPAANNFRRPVPFATTKGFRPRGCYLGDASRLDLIMRVRAVRESRDKPHVREASRWRRTDAGRGARTGQHLGEIEYAVSLEHARRCGCHKRLRLLPVGTFRSAHKKASATIDWTMLRKRSVALDRVMCSMDKPLRQTTARNQKHGNRKHPGWLVAFCAAGKCMKIRQASWNTVTEAFMALTISVAISIAGCGGSSSAADTTSSSLLPRNFVVLVNLVNQYFDAVTQQESTGEDSTAQGNPVATRAVFFVNDSGTLLVTITADRYRNTSDAASAYQTALQKSEAVPGFTPISIPPVGQQSFAGSVTQGTETHVGLGALDGKFVFGATLAGFDATSDNVANLVGLARAQDAAIDAATALPVAI